ncbi:hypothetical protein SNE25_18190 [Mucilaginibacter sabulilitoris]|uniref:Uncharacterized protein n=1 Tax=Mucilaginibacter sabulilitoris TaxID=1173583 RepID=A0ABZ0THQ6_9SPHI|nr:hypothetical protein [Mucilaginibacter sabulilitoris]WPU91249.1 hypothetical protein SNE25_18190 [Mucilaginibacter sabulilitoris]
MKLFILILITCTIGVYYRAEAQTGSLNGVYAGCQFTVSPLIGGGMNRRDIVFLFRPDGTFNDQMGQADWKTRVSGKYTVSGSKIDLNFAGGHSQYTIKDASTLYGHGYNLFKLQGNIIPPGYYEFISAMGSGGGVSGLAYVGTSTHRGLNFDANGHFSNSRSSATLIAGDNVGGGSTSSGNGSGIYKIKDGVLTLTYSDGKTELHSFFCDKPGMKTQMAMVDGRIYFKNNDKETDKPVAAKTTSTASNNITATSPVTNNTDGMALLLRANNTHGGAKLNNVKTARLTATIMGIKAVELIDLDNSRIRVELWKNGKLSSVEQTEGDNGWQWINGSKTMLPADKVASDKSTLYSNVLGLRKAALDKMQILNTQKTPNNNIYTVECKLDGNNYVFAVNDQNQLVAFGYRIGGKTSTSLLSDMRQVQGISIPFHEVSTSGTQKLTIQYDNMEVNPVFDASNWTVPPSN